MANSAVKSVFAPGLFKSRVAIVTGGGTGIGQAISRELAHLGCSVVIASRKADRLAAAAEKLAVDCREGARVHHTVCNIRQEADVQRLVSETLDKFGRLDFLVNNGGGQFVCPASDMKLKGWNAVIETNLTGTFLCIREAHRQWMKRNGGSIVNIVMDAYKGWPMFAHSAAARSAVENLSKTLAVEWASDRIRINCVAPGIIYSETAVANYGEQGREVFLRSKARVPARRFGHVEEISAAVAFLCSPAAGYVTGQTLYVDGAVSLYRTQFFDVPEFEPAEGWYWEESSKAKL
uniref:Peroxisomal trans-2-enoyl-CoA reductase n=2 Tax=Macrostomum lignano TaxID=282301 RepID=A0A1I8I432_9PLAT